MPRFGQYWDGFKSSEAAEILGLNPSTARSRLAKVLHELHASLAASIR
ncbi:MULTISPECIES: sigma factor-like helix-turn-helix DNA-binding protein [unclassified Plantibacter]